MPGKNKPVPTKGLFVTNAASSAPPLAGVAQGAQRDGVIFSSAARAAATYTTDPYFSPDIRGLRLYIDITNINGGTVTVKVQIQDPSSLNWVDFPLAVTTALAANATTTLSIYPGQTETANQDISDAFTDTWRVVVTVATATVTFSIGGEYLE